MSIELLGPIVYVGLWVFFLFRSRIPPSIWVAFYFVSIASFSANHEFVFRSVHQIIQIPMAVLGIYYIVTSRVDRRVSYPLLAFLALILFSTLVAGRNAGTVAQVINFTVAAGVSAFALSHLARLSAQQLRELGRFLGHLGAAAAVLALVEYAGGMRDRLEGTFGNPNYFALFLGVAYCFSLSFSSGAERLSISALVLVAIFLSGSRAGMLLPVMAHVWHAYKAQNIGGKLWRIALLLSAFASFFVISGPDFGRAGTGSSDAERVILTRIGIDMARESPWTGIGWGGFASNFGGYARGQSPIYVGAEIVDMSLQQGRVSHNDFVRILAELGVPAFGLAVGFSILTLWRAFKSRGTYGLVQFPIVVGLIGFSLTHNNLNTAFFWILFLMPSLAALSRERPDQRRVEPTAMTDPVDGAFERRDGHSRR